METSFAQAVATSPRSFMCTMLLAMAHDLRHPLLTSVPGSESRHSAKPADTSNGYLNSTPDPNTMAKKKKGIIRVSGDEFDRLYPQYEKALKKAKKTMTFQQWLQQRKRPVSK